VLDSWTAGLLAGNAAACLSFGLSSFCRWLRWLHMLWFLSVTIFESQQPQLPQGNSSRAKRVDASSGSRGARPLAVQLRAAGFCAAVCGAEFLVAWMGVGSVSKAGRWQRAAGTAALRIFTSAHTAPRTYTEQTTTQRSHRAARAAHLCHRRTSPARFPASCPRSQRRP
jgi:hypothetical protein